MLFFDTIVAECGKPKHEYESCAIPEELFDAIKEIVPPAEMEQAVFTDEKQIREDNIRQITEKLEELKAEFDCVTERRGKGLMQGLVITKPIKEINDRAIEEGLLIIQAQGNVIRFVPPLIVEKEHIDQMVEKMRRILA